MSRCPACGATHPDAAEWCGQCYRRFDDDDAAVPSPNGSVTPVPDATAQGFRRVGDELQWECPQCGQLNGIELTACAVCATSFLQRFRSEEPEPPRNWVAAMVLSAILPGAGHLSVGRHGTGWARLLLFVVWIAGAVTLATSAGSGVLLVAAPLLLGALALWMVSLVDVYRLQQGHDDLLAGRAFLWLVVGVLLAMMVALFGSAGLG
jgi:TM2 domain-containing membrane protein YozV